MPCVGRGHGPASRPRAAEEKRDTTSNHTRIGHSEASFGRCPPGRATEALRVCVSPPTFLHPRPRDQDPLDTEPPAALSPYVASPPRSLMVNSSVLFISHHRSVTFVPLSRPLPPLTVSRSRPLCPPAPSPTFVTFLVPSGPVRRR